MYEHCFLQLDNETKASLRLLTSPLVGFSGQVLWPLGVITTSFTFSYYAGKGSRTITTDFMIVRAPSPYNVILGRPGMRQLGAISSTIHLLIKFPLKSGVAIIRGDMPQKNRCLQISYQPVGIGTRLPARIKQELQRILCENKDIFAWSLCDMTGIPRELAEHKLNIHPCTFPVRQKKRVLAKDRNEADETWRMCIDFTNLNKSCPKDSCPPPEIDQKIESLDGFRYKFFLDAYKGYHQIRMAEEDEEKTTFYTEQGTFCYEKMPFGLKNAGATYQRLVDKAFSSQIGQNIEIYVDDMVIKNKEITTSKMFGIPPLFAANGFSHSDSDESVVSCSRTMIFVVGASSSSNSSPHPVAATSSIGMVDCVESYLT
ncbi:reverse transcriptase domain-containing protein [Tanacetum coccineum]